MPPADKEVSIWRNYDVGAVGVAAGGAPPRMLPPDEARELANSMELLPEQKELPPRDRAQTERMARDLRRFADDVEGAGGDGDAA